MPALPATSVTPLYLLVVSADVDEKLTLAVCIVRLWRMLNVTGVDTLRLAACPPSSGLMLVVSLSVRRNCSCAVMLTLVPVAAGAPRPPRPPPNPPPPRPPPRPPPAAAGVKLCVTRRLTVSPADGVVVV